MPRSVLIPDWDIALCEVTTNWGTKHFEFAVVEHYKDGTVVSAVPLQNVFDSVEELQFAMQAMHRAAARGVTCRLYRQTSLQ